MGSGSSGNSCFVSSGNTHIVIDAGFSAAELERRIEAIGSSIRELSAIVVSHEHDDHIKGVSVLSRRFRLPVYGSEKMMEASSLEKKRIFAFEPVRTGEEFRIGDLEFHPFPVPHDAEDPFGFLVYAHGFKLGYVTDLGFVPGYVKEYLKDSHVLVLESNHDVDLLKAGPYPWPLKQRILGKFGHLSNDALAGFLEDLDMSSCEHLFLAHLSQINNDPVLALDCSKSVLKNKETCSAAIHLTYQERPSAVARLW